MNLAGTWPRMALHCVVLGVPSKVIVMVRGAGDVQASRPSAAIPSAGIASRTMILRLPFIFTIPKV